MEAWGIELMEGGPGQEATKKLDKVLIGPCENFLEQLPDHFFDAIYCNGVLEHLEDPYSVLGILKDKLTDRG